MLAPASHSIAQLPGGAANPPRPVQPEVQLGAEVPLAIFDHEFAIGIELAVAASFPEGTLEIPTSLRYQTSDEQMCYPPATTITSFTVRVEASDAAIENINADVLDGIRFGEGRVPDPSTATGSTAQSRMAADSWAGAGLDRLDDFPMLGSTGYLDTDDFLTFVNNAGNGIQPAGLFAGRGPLAIMLIVLLGGLALNLTPCVLPMIPIHLAIIGGGLCTSSTLSA